MTRKPNPFEHLTSNYLLSLKLKKGLDLLSNRALKKFMTIDQ